MKELEESRALWIVKSQMTNGGSVLLCSLYSRRYRRSECFYNSCKPQNCWVAEFEHQLRPPDSNTCSISLQGTFVSGSIKHRNFYQQAAVISTHQGQRKQAEPLESLSPVWRIIYHVWTQFALKSLLLRDGPWTSNIGITGSLLGMQDLRPQGRLLNQKCR